MRAYQTGFYYLSERVRDRESRLYQADKIKFVLTQRTNYLFAQARCLDLGCSSGVMTTALAPLFLSIVGLDYDGVALEHIAPSDARAANFLRGDAMQLPFPNQAFDVVICAQVYEHVPDDRKLFAELDRVLAPRGIVFFSGPNWLFPIEPHYFLPFLHWLPTKAADAYLRLFKLGEHYYERSRSWWDLRQRLSRFTILDVTLDVLRHQQASSHRRLLRWLKYVPHGIWQPLLPAFPNFNWILQKPDVL